MPDVFTVVMFPGLQGGPFSPEMTTTGQLAYTDGVGMPVNATADEPWLTLITFGGDQNVVTRFEELTGGGAPFALFPFCESFNLALLPAAAVGWLCLVQGYRKRTRSNRRT